MAERLPDGPVTIVFSDVVGSTDLRTERGDAAAHRLLREHEEIVHRCVVAHDGREVKALGDGFMLAFASVRRALDCAVAIQQASAERNSESPGEEVHVRIGVNTGEVVVENGDLYGQAVNAAARIAAVAEAGEVLVSDIVRQLTGSGAGMTFVDRGEFGLKGFPEPWRLHAAIAQAAEAPVGLLGRTPFVGRQAERVELRRVLAQVQSGTGAFVMIGGEPGVGKTRLAEELARRCEREGFLVYTGHCYDMAGAAPYIPIVEIYEQALSGAPDPATFREFLADEAPDVARLVPRLRQFCPDIPPPLELPAEQERRYLFNSLWEVLARTARRRPVLLVLDDIHWADEPTMLLIQHCAERVAEVPLLMVGLYRDTELDAGRPLSRVFGELTRRRLAVRLPLRRLPAESVAEMLKALAGQEPPAELVEVIYSETEGNAFFTEEVFKHLSEEGRLFDSTGRFRTSLAVAELDVPESVRLVVGARLQRLGPDSPKVLGSAAVLGRVFAFELLRELEQMPEEQLLVLLEEAQRSGVIVPVAGRAEDELFMFAHELIRQTVLGEVSALRRRRLHARAAEALERFHAVALEPHAARIAHHLIEAGPAADPKRTFRYLSMAGRWALETAAFEEALTHLEDAASRMDAASPAERAELLAQLGTARRGAGEWMGAIETWQNAFDAYAALGEVEAASRVCADAAYSLAMMAARLEEGMAWIERGIGLVGDRVSATRAALLALKGGFVAADGAPGFDVGAGLLDQALAIADELDQPALRGSCLLAKSAHRLMWMHLLEVAEAALEAADLLKRAGNSWEEALALGWAGYGLIGAGRFEEAREVAAHLEPLAERLGQAPQLMQCRRIAHMVGYAETGDVGAVEAFAWRDLRLAADNGLPWVSNSHGWLGMAFFLKGDWDRARGELETAADLEPPTALRGWDRGLLLEFRAYAGERERALAMLDAEDALLPVPGRPNTWGRWSMLLAAVEGLYVLGERDRAASYYDLVVECIQDTRVICAGFQGSRLVHRTAAIAATAGRSWDAAEHLFRTALRQAAELPHLPEQAHTRRFYAAMLLDREDPGDRAEASRLRAEAADLYRRMGMPRHLAMVDEMQS